MTGHPHAASFADLFATAWGQGGERALELFDERIRPDAKFEQPMLPNADSWAAMKEGFRRLFAAIPDLRGEVTRWGATHDGVLIEVVLRGTASGRPIELTTVDRFVLDDEGWVVFRVARFDPAPLVAQLATRPAAMAKLLPAMFGRADAGRATWRSPDLGEARELTHPQGTLRYFEAGSGAPIVFVHGLLVNANLWRKVIARLAPDFRCIALDMPAGSHTIPMPGADLSPNGSADLVADAVEALGLDEVTLVGNDSGGGICQVVAARRPERIGRLVLTSCDYRDRGLPPVFAPLFQLAKVPGGLATALRSLRPQALRYLPIAFGWLVKRRIDPPAMESYVRPAVDIPGIEEDARRYINNFDTRQLVAAADRLSNFDRPALILWSREDKVFAPADAESLLSDLPNAQLEWVDDARTFSMEDNPASVATSIATFIHKS